MWSVPTYVLLKVWSSGAIYLCLYSLLFSNPKIACPLWNSNFTFIVLMSSSRGPLSFYSRWLFVPTSFSCSSLFRLGLLPWKIKPAWLFSSAGFTINSLSSKWPNIEDSSSFLFIFYFLLFVGCWVSNPLFFYKFPNMIALMTMHGSNPT